MYLCRNNFSYANQKFLKGEVYNDLPAQKFEGYFQEIKKVAEHEGEKVETAALPKKRGRKKKS